MSAGKAVFEDRHLALAQALDPLGVDVGAHDLVAEMGQARGGREADVAGADDGDAHRVGHFRRSRRSGRGIGHEEMLGGVLAAGFRNRATRIGRRTGGGRGAGLPAAGRCRGRR